MATEREKIDYLLNELLNTYDGSVTDVCVISRAINFAWNHRKYEKVFGENLDSPMLKFALEEALEIVQKEGGIIYADHEC